MKRQAMLPNSFPSQLASFMLASALVSLPAFAQQPRPAAPPDNNPSSTVQQEQPSPEATPTVAPAKEGFWGHVNPFARKKWVKKQTDPINDRLGELDEVNAKNAHDIQDVDSRSQAGIRQAQSTADSAGQAASAADAKARAAGDTAQTASTHADHLNDTVGGLDQYHQINEVEVEFRSGQPIVSATARKKLDDLATAVTGQQGYILEIEAHSPLAGGAGLQSSQRMAEAVERYLVTKHEIPVYRMHSVALGNAQAAAGDEAGKPVRSSRVHVRLMENSLAAQEAAPPQGAVSSAGAERP